VDGQSPLISSFDLLAYLPTALAVNIYLESVHKVDYFVIPAEAGIQNRLKSLDSRFHGNDGKAIYKQTLLKS